MRARAGFHTFLAATTALRSLAVPPPPAAAMLPPPQQHQWQRHRDSAQARPLLPQRCCHAIGCLHPVSCCCGGLQGGAESKTSLCEACAHGEGDACRRCCCYCCCCRRCGTLGGLAGCTSLQRMAVNQPSHSPQHCLQGRHSAVCPAPTLLACMARRSSSRSAGGSLRRKAKRYLQPSEATAAAGCHLGWHATV